MRIRKSVCLVLVQLVVLSAFFGIPAKSQGYLPWPDFANVTPIVVDSTGDESPDYDIISCRITFDDDYIYFHIRVLGTVQPESLYIWVDANASSATGDKSGVLGEHNLGADYYVHPTGGGAVIAYLYRWTGSAWERSKPLDFKRDENSISIAVARVDLGNPTKINVLFVMERGTDYVPNEGFASLNVPPAGGAQPGANLLLTVAPYIVAAIIMVVVVAVFFVFSRRREGFFSTK